MERAEKTGILETPPVHLIVSLSRFRYDAAARTRRKLETKVDCPMLLTLPGGHACPMLVERGSGATLSGNAPPPH